MANVALALIRAEKIKELAKTIIGCLFMNSGPMAKKITIFSTFLMYLSCKMLIFVF